MPSGNPNWIPGHKTTNGHRPPGSRNRRTKEILDRLRERGDKDPVDFLSEVVTNANDEHSTDLRLQASSILAPYCHSKVGATPPLRFLEEPFNLPNPSPTTETEISANIGALNQAYASGHLDLDSYQTMLAGQHQHINALKAREDIPANMDIRITGGLPELPGTNITMSELPSMNGHQMLAPPEARILPEHNPDRDPVIPSDDPPAPTGGEL